MRRSVVVGLAIGFAVVVLVWLLFLQFWLIGLRDRVWLIEAVSLGMTREEVITRLGKPSYTLEPGDVRLNTQAEVLLYRSWRSTFSAVMVILDERGRVVSVFYPEYHVPPIGGIEVDRADEPSGKRGQQP